MGTDTTTSEGRLCPRSRPKETALAIFSRPDFYDHHKLGKIIDISSGGLSLQYVSLGDHVLENTEVEIIGVGVPPLRISGINCSIIYDFKCVKSSWGFLMVRRCGMSFNHLDPFRRKQLQLFIESYTVDG